MTSRETAEALRDAGLRWTPARGDRFLVPDRDLDDQVFVVSDMVIEAVDIPQGPRILAFNGTTEWALDSVEQDKVVWLPREDQLRDLLGDAFVSLEHLEGGYAVTVRGRAGDLERHVDIDAERAYARAVVARLGSSAPDEEQTA